MLFQNSTDSKAAYVGLDGAGYFNVDAGTLLLTTSGTESIIFGTNNGTQRASINNSGNFAATGTVSDSKGNLRSIPANAKSSAYTLIASDAGKHISTTAAVTIPPSVFSVGDAITIYNDSGSDIALTRGSGVTMYNSADATNADRTLAGRGLATLMMVGTNHFVISGAGLS